MTFTRMRLIRSFMNLRLSETSFEMLHLLLKLLNVTNFKSWNKRWGFFNNRELYRAREIEECWRYEIETRSNHVTRCFFNDFTRLDKRRYDDFDYFEKFGGLGNLKRLDLEFEFNSRFGFEAFEGWENDKNNRNNDSETNMHYEIV